MEPKDVLDFAYNLYKAHDTEVAYRTCIGRSYYAVFYPAKQTVGRLGLKGQGNTHDRVISAFARQHPAIHNAMSDLFSDRIKADYFLGGQVSASEARAALSKAKVLQKKLSEL